MVSTAEVTKEQRGTLLEQILASERFRRSKRLSDFLKFVVEAELSGLADQLTEQQIGQQVYGKPPGYNAAEENVVRVEARRLRLALGAYFNEEGRRHEWVLEIPRGHYVPVYRRREQVGAQVPEAGGPTVETSAGERTGSRRWLKPSLLGLTAGFVLGIGLASFSGGQPVSPSEDNPILASLNTADSDTLVVVADSQWAAMQQLTKTDVSLSDYLDRDFSWDQRHPSQWNLDFIASRQFVAVSNIHFLKRMIEALGPNARKTSVKFARDLRPRDLRNNNLIFLGSARSIPWVELFEDKLNFVLEGPHFHNRAPREKEQPLYRAGERPSGHREVFAHLAALPNLSGNGQVLIIQGTGMSGTEAAANYLLDTARAKELIAKAHAPNDSGVLRFEVLLRSFELAGAPSTIEVVALRSPLLERRRVALR